MQHRTWVVVVLLFFSVFLLPSCASTTKAPHWVDSVYDKEYDQDTYLCAVGSGSTRQKAIDGALGALSQIFNSQVKSVTEVTSLSTAVDDEQGKTQFSQASEMLEYGSITSNTDSIIGSEVVNVYTDQLGRVYVRVALHRERTIELYQKKLSELSQTLAQGKGQALLSPQKLRQYVLLRKAREVAIQMQVFIDQLAVLLGKGQASPLVSLDRELATLASSISVDVCVTAEDAEEEVLQAAFARGLQNLGFVIDSTLPSAVLEVGYAVEPIQLSGSPYQYARYMLTAELKDAQISYVSYEATQREAALSEADAMAKALNTAVSDGVSAFFTLMLDTLGEEQ